MYHNKELEYLTEGYMPVAQMAIALAEQLGYLNDPFYAVIAPHGDATSAGLPYIINARPIDNRTYQFLSYDDQQVHTVAPEFQVLVYLIPDEQLSDQEHYKLLCKFANQFDENSLIGKLLTPALLHWVAENDDHPDIFWELQRMRNIANRLDGHLDDLEELI